MKIKIENLIELSCQVNQEQGGYVSAKSVSEPIRTRRGIIQVRAKDEDGNTLQCTSDHLRETIKASEGKTSGRFTTLANKIIKYYNELPDAKKIDSESKVIVWNDFLVECNTVVNIPDIDVEDKSNSKAIGIIAYLPEGYRRAIEKQEKKQKAIDDNKDSKSDFVGTEGTRLQTKATVVDIKPIRNRDFSVVSCVDEDDNVIKWFEGDTYDIKTNKLYDLSGFIKSHSVNSYNNVKETIINRVRFA